jgi:hypothetical protein
MRKGETALPKITSQAVGEPSQVSLPDSLYNVERQEVVSTERNFGISPIGKSNKYW